MEGSARHHNFALQIIDSIISAAVKAPAIGIKGRISADGASVRSAGVLIVDMEGSAAEGGLKVSDIIIELDVDGRFQARPGRSWAAPA